MPQRKPVRDIAREIRRKSEAVMRESGVM